MNCYFLIVALYLFLFTESSVAPSCPANYGKDHKVQEIFLQQPKHNMLHENLKCHRKALNKKSEIIKLYQNDSSVDFEAVLSLLTPMVNKLHKMRIEDPYKKYSEEKCPQYLEKLQDITLFDSEDLITFLKQKYSSLSSLMDFLLSFDTIKKYVSQIAQSGNILCTDSSMNPYAIVFRYGDFLPSKLFCGVLHELDSKLHSMLNPCFIQSVIQYELRCQSFLNQIYRQCRKPSIDQKIWIPDVLPSKRCYYCSTSYQKVVDIYFPNYNFASMAKCGTDTIDEIYAEEKYLLYFLFTAIEKLTKYTTLRNICNIDHSVGELLPGWKTLELIKIPTLHEKTKYDEVSSHLTLMAFSEPVELEKIHYCKLLITIRGTITSKEWLINFNYMHTEFDDPVYGKLSVHSGYYNLYTVLEPTISNYIDAKLKVCHDLEVTITGYSLGGGLSQVASLLLSLKYYKQSVRINNVAFASPNVFDYNAAHAYNALVNGRIMILEMDFIHNTPCTTHIFGDGIYYCSDVDKQYPLKHVQPRIIKRSNYVHTPGQYVIKRTDIPIENLSDDAFLFFKPHFLSLAKLFKNSQATFSFSDPSVIESIKEAIQQTDIKGTLHIRIPEILTPPIFHKCAYSCWLSFTLRQSAKNPNTACEDCATKMQWLKFNV